MREGGVPGRAVTPIKALDVGNVSLIYGADIESLLIHNAVYYQEEAIQQNINDNSLLQSQVKALAHVADAQNGAKLKRRNKACVARPLSGLAPMATESPSQAPPVEG